MKNNKLPNKKEWNDIINEAFSSDTEHHFSERYRQKKEKINGGIIMKKSTFTPEKIFIGLTTAAVLAVVAVPTAAFTLNRINNSDAPASQITTEAVTESAAATKETNVKEMPADPENSTVPDTTSQQSVSTGFMAISCDNLPSGYHEIDTKAYDDDHLYAPRSILLGGGDPFHSIWADLFIISEKYEFDPEVVINHSMLNPGKLDTFRIDNKTVYMVHSLETHAPLKIVALVLFDDSNYVVDVAATEDDSEEDVKEFIKGLSLVPSQTTVPVPEIYNPRFPD